MRKIHVLLATDLSNIGGTELSTLSIGRWMSQAGHEVTVMANEHPLIEEFSSHGIHIVLGTMNRRDPIGVIRGTKDLRRCIIQERVDIIHAQMAWTALLAGLASRTVRSRKVPVVWHCRGVKPRTYGVMAHLGNFLLDFVIANCEAEQIRLLERGLSPRRIRTIYNFPNVDLPQPMFSKEASIKETWGIEPGTMVVGTVSRLAEHRGIRTFLEAIALLQVQPLPPVHFLVVGDGPQEAELREMVAELDIADEVTFTGARRDMERVYSVLDVLVNPTLWGMGTGNVNSEAMAWRIPIIATEVGGIPELVDNGRAGLLVPPGDSARLAEAIRYLLEQPNIAAQMGVAGQRKVNAMMNPERVIREIEAVYSLVLNRHG